jgi:hypothetical protein
MSLSEVPIPRLRTMSSEPPPEGSRSRGTAHSVDIETVTRFRAVKREGGATSNWNDLLDIETLLKSIAHGISYRLLIYDALAPRRQAGLLGQCWQNHPCSRKHKTAVTHLSPSVLRSLKRCNPRVQWFHSLEILRAQNESVDVRGRGSWDGLAGQCPIHSSEKHPTG